MTAACVLLAVAALSPVQEADVNYRPIRTFDDAAASPKPGRRGVTGTFVWGDVSRPLAAGRNEVDVKGMK